MHPIFSLDNLSRLPTSIRSLAIVASTTSPTKQDLLLIKRAGDLTPGQKMHLLPVPYSVLDPAKIPVVDNLDGRFSLERLASAIVKANFAFGLLTAEYNPIDIPKEAFQDLWGRAWKWISFLEAQPYVHLDNAGRDRDSRGLIYVNLFLNNPDTHQVIYATPGVCGMVSKLWAAAPRPGGRIVSNITFGNLCQFLRRCKGLDDHLLDEFVEGQGGHGDPQIPVLRKPRISWHNGRIGIRRAHTGGVKSTYTAHTAELCWQLLKRFLVNECSGPQGLMEALSAGLLPAILYGCDSKRTRNTREILIKILHTYLPASTVYHSVLTLLQKRSDDELLERVTTEEFSDCSLYPVSEPFAALVTERIKLLNWFNSREIESLKGCDNMEDASASTTVPKRVNPVIGGKGAIATFVEIFGIYGSSIFLAQIAMLKQFPDEPFCTTFNYTEGHPYVSVARVSELEDIVSNTLRLTNFVAHEKASAGRVETHVMLVGQHKSSRFKVLPMYSSGSLVRESLERMEHVVSAEKLSGPEGLLQPCPPELKNEIRRLDEEQDDKVLYTHSLMPIIRWMGLNLNRDTPSVDRLCV
ncbi:hypothetical protein DFH06DRAFT_1136066 [Mycena polygramma]|nr:hypothetical protein DFH06DRAFT_1136066 [Mycena polygramma]